MTCSARVVAIVGSRRSLVLDGSLGYCIAAIVEEHEGALVCVAEDYLYDNPLLQRISSLAPDQAERAADDDGDRQVDDVAPGDELLEFLDHAMALPVGVNPT